MRAFLILPLLVLPLHAAPHLSEMTVKGDLGSSNINTFNKKDLKQKQYQSAVSLLNAHPSVEIKESGGTTSLYLRGTSSAHNIVILNGLVVNNPSIDNQFDFSTLDPNDIEKIEIITGAKALYYGSGALGGVIKITTKKATTGTTARGRFEVGSFDTRKAQLSLGHRSKKFGLLGGINIGNSGSKTRWNHHHQVHNADGYRATSGSLFMDAKVNDHYGLDLYIQGGESKTDLNDYDNATDKQSFLGGNTRHYNNRIALKNNLSLLNEKWQQSLTLGLQNNRRKTIAQSNSTFIAKRESVDYDSTYELADWVSLNGGLSYMREYDHSLNVTNKAFDSKGILGKVEFDLLENLEVFVAARLDKHERFKAHTTWQTGLTWDVTEVTTLEMSMGTGFKAPSIQTFTGTNPLQNLVGTNTFQQPNPDAKPEKSFLWDVSLKQYFLKKKLMIQATYFNNKIKDILVWDTPTSMPKNKDERTSRGAELALKYKLNGHWNFGGSFTYLRVFDREPAKRALNIPIYKTTLSIDYSPTKKLSFFTEVVHKSRQMNYGDKRINAITDMRLGGRYNWSENIEFFGRIENALNQKIEESYGFGRRGLGIFGGFILKT